MILDKSGPEFGKFQDVLEKIEIYKVSKTTTNTKTAIDIVKEFNFDLIIFIGSIISHIEIDFLKSIDDKNAAGKNIFPTGVLLILPETEQMEKINSNIKTFLPFSFVITGGKNLIENSTPIMKEIELYRKRILRKIHLTSKTRHLNLDQNKIKRKTKIIIVGASTGGPRALMKILPELCNKTDLPIIAIQHMPHTFTQIFAEGLNKKCKHEVKEVDHHEEIKKNHIYIAPGGMHLICSGTAGSQFLQTTNFEAVNGCKPSIDVFLKTSVNVFGSKAALCILTGMGRDGVAGARLLKEAGSPIIVQNEETSVVWSMPGSLVSEDLADQILPLEKIADALAKLS